MAVNMACASSSRSWLETQQLKAGGAAAAYQMVFRHCKGILSFKKVAREQRYAADQQVTAAC